jgi:hypothetical protein
MLTPLLKVLRKFAPLILGIVAVLVVLVGMDACSKTKEDAYLKQVATHQQVAKKALEANVAANKRVSELDGKVTVLVSTNGKLEQDLLKAKSQTKTAKDNAATAKDSLKTASTLLDSNVVLTTIVSHQYTVITSLTLENSVLGFQKTNLGKQIAMKDSINTILTADNTRLLNVVQRIPKPNKCDNKFLFCKLNKPTRTTSFLAGLGTTLIAGVLIR